MAQELGTELQDMEMLLYRQVHPSWVHDGRVTSQAFRPTPKDKDLLSVARNNLVTDEEAFRFHVEKLGLESLGTWGITVKECSDLGLTAHEDPLTSPEPYEAHSVVNFAPYSSKEKTNMSKKLAAKARDRGQLYSP